MAVSSRVALSFGKRLCSSMSLASRALDSLLDSLARFPLSDPVPHGPELALRTGCSARSNTARAAWKEVTGFLECPDGRTDGLGDGDQLACVEGRLPSEGENGEAGQELGKGSGEGTSDRRNVCGRSSPTVESSEPGEVARSSPGAMASSSTTAASSATAAASATRSTTRGGGRRGSLGIARFLRNLALSLSPCPMLALLVASMRALAGGLCPLPVGRPTSCLRHNGPSIQKLEPWPRGTTGTGGSALAGSGLVGLVCFRLAPFWTVAGMSSFVAFGVVRESLESFPLVTCPPRRPVSDDSYINCPLCRNHTPWSCVGETPQR